MSKKNHSDRWVENRRRVKGYPPGTRSGTIPRSILRAMVRVCVLCGYDEDEDELHIDHINKNSTDNRAENLRVLCPECHLGVTPITSPYRSFLEHDVRLFQQRRAR